MKKALIFIYGILSYVVFLASFLYAIGFLGQFIVPKHINSGTESNLTMSIVINLILLSLFAIQHSIMARPSFKKWWTKIINPAIERSTFVLLTSLLLFLIFWKWQPMTDKVWNIEGETYVLIINIIFWVGWAIVLLSTFMINHFHLFGLDQVYNKLKSKPPTGLKFKEHFFYKLVRHPIMTGFIIAFWATPEMTTGHLLFAVVTTLYIIVAVKYFEERDLRNELGDAYVSYQKRVPMLIPFLKLGKKP
ncbi:MAG: isoprenylcysteine carboxylmethyltransferase family protein [Bacteroidia bacterium]|nr:isoprenylcysteine carboxylmethyltransferase family protein [Bacteroidia bacterium]NND25433.1 isoprenylcysteine carboxylmethyltransferase family protein [Flavobacteriaceae bacterium]MBT8277512.1 isoprenylcysteine carboxylmethyltransferase family protein [Bacteroidia bacterium]NNK60603.1 isoprenylcysteine carboxylmethyltransferase family protein [Flavobacteriaceae bacterium]NNL33676.1 isoprenylcysteine carboxylmethyltransferase family protein [Flavobacteriaceae bacterium]